MSARILVVDDEPQIGRLLTTSLGARGYEVAVASDGQAALELAASWRPDLILLDLGLPIIAGLDVCRQLRAWSQVPIIVLTVRDAEQDKVAALDLGADDYLTKPFGTAELLARIRVALRHAAHLSVTAEPVRQFGDLRIDLARRLVVVRDQAVHLTPRDAARVRSAAGAGDAGRQGADAPAALAGGVGRRLRAGCGDLARVRDPAAAQDRSRPRASNPHPDRARHRVPLPGRRVKVRG